MRINKEADVLKKEVSTSILNSSAASVSDDIMPDSSIPSGRKSTSEGSHQATKTGEDQTPTVQELNDKAEKEIQEEDDAHKRRIMDLMERFKHESPKNPALKEPATRSLLGGASPIIKTGRTVYKKQTSHNFVPRSRIIN